MTETNIQAGERTQPIHSKDTALLHLSRAKAEGKRISDDNVTEQLTNAERALRYASASAEFDSQTQREINDSLFRVSQTLKEHKQGLARRAKLSHVLWNTETEQTEGFQGMTLAESKACNDVLRDKGEPQRWLVSDSIESEE